MDAVTSLVPVPRSIAICALAAPAWEMDKVSAARSVDRELVAKLASVVGAGPVGGLANFLEQITKMKLDTETYHVAANLAADLRAKRGGSVDEDPHQELMQVLRRA